MRYIYLDISKEDLELKTKRDKWKTIESCEGASPHGWEDEDKKVRDNCSKCKLAFKEWVEVRELQMAIFGEKDLLEKVLDNSKAVGSGKDLKIYTRTYDLLETLKDPCWLRLEEDDWKWLKEKMEHDQYGVTYKNQMGNDVAAYNGLIKRKIGRLLIKLDEATTTMPEELVKKLELEEAAKSKEEVKESKESVEAA